MKKVVAVMLLSLGLVGCAAPPSCAAAHEEIKVLVERHIELHREIKTAGGMADAPADLKEAYWDNQDELKVAYAHSNEVCTP